MLDEYISCAYNVSVGASHRGDREPRDAALTPATWQVLLALAEGERHGYAIMRDVNAQADTEGGVRLGPGTLYRTIRRLLEAGLIAEAQERPDPALDDERRRYYRITPAGRRVAVAEAERLVRLVESARRRRLLGSSVGVVRGGA
jgi:DNA-binding PadR family transcriptional regulator